MAHQGNGQGQEPSPEQADIYKRTILAAQKILYSDGTYEGVIKMLQQGNDPIKAVAEVATLILRQLVQRMEGRLTPDILQGALLEIVALVAELGAKEGFFQIDETMFKQIVMAVGQGLAEQGQPRPQQAPPQAQPAPPQGILAGAMGGQGAQ